MLTYRQFLGESVSDKEKMLNAFIWNDFAYGSDEPGMKKIFDYATNVVKVPWPEFIEKFTEYFIKECNDVREDIGEDSSAMGDHGVVCFFEEFLPNYFNVVLKQNRQYLSKMEDFMLKFKDGYMCFYYTWIVIRKRWPEAEVVIAQDENAWKDYLTNFKGSFSDADRWQWIQKFPIPDLVKALNVAGWGDSEAATRKIQDTVIKKRPDLIGEIEDLNSTLKAKYSHEVELGEVDL
jgi:uncharacterized protein Usg